MVKLSTTNRPIELTDEVVKTLTAEFLMRNTPVWNKSYIKRDLLKMGHGKCAYCECLVDEESKYLEIEHFLPKEAYKDKVVDWENLLPSCKRCNANKGSHDPAKSPIINPSKDNPTDHLLLRDYVFRKKTSIGEETINVLNLNDYERLVGVRFRIGSEVYNRLDEISILIDQYLISPGARTRNKLRGQLKALLNEALPTSEYSATVATVLIGDKKFDEVVIKYKEAKLWDDTFETLKDQATLIAYERY